MTTEEQQDQKNQEEPENKNYSAYSKYSAIVIQMGVIIFLTTWGGIKLDKVTGNEKPVFAIILSLLGVFSAIWVAVKDLIKK
ncbi:MAG: AtpZ/AtpI family protein [Bacteroidota bacterium]